MPELFAEVTAIKDAGKAQKEIRKGGKVVRNHFGHHSTPPWEELREAQLHGAKVEGPYKRRSTRYITILKITIVIVILLIGILTLIRLDTIMSDQYMIFKTQSDCMDQIMWLRQEVDELKDDPEASIHYPLTREERDLVERIVAAEARGESLEGMMAVAQVIRDRSQLWGMTVTEVCLAPGQFAAPYQGEISPEIVQAVWAVFDEGMSVLEIPTTHFHADYVSPYWTESKVSRGSVGAHRFYGE